MVNLKLREKIIGQIMKAKHLSHTAAEKEFAKLTKGMPEKDWEKVVGGYVTERQRGGLRA